MRASRRKGSPIRFDRNGHSTVKGLGDANDASLVKLTLRRCMLKSIIGISGHLQLAGHAEGQASDARCVESNPEDVMHWVNATAQPT